MQIVETSKEISDLVSSIKMQKKSIGFVPTMGYLHDGHISLVRKSKEQSDFTVVSVFVNPSQFNDAKDLELYPRDLKRDCELLEQAGADLVFAPSAGEIYPAGFQSFVTVEDLSLLHEGEFRPGHFRGVTTIVNILFNLVRPDCAFFGEKDFQQLAIIKRMNEDLRMGLKVTGCPIVREPDGLALSSRNVRLNSEAREKAPQIYKALQSIQTGFKAGRTKSAELISSASNGITDPDFRVEYVRIIDPVSLEQKEIASKGDRVIAAVHLGGVRLIDNVEL